IVNKNLPGFFPLPVGRTDVAKYASFRKEPSGPYLLMISGSPYPDASHNLIATVMGPQEQRARELMQEFERAIPVLLRPAPPALQRFYDQSMKQFSQILQYL
ncbi:hypothetical protein HZB90_00945, partial [archaeon]|nr:hypothetical protein [archaeon]